MPKRKEVRSTDEEPTADCALIGTFALRTPLQRAASGRGYDWLKGTFLSLQRSPLDRHSYYERFIRTWNDIYNHHDIDRLHDFMRSNVSETLLISSKYSHHPSKPDTHPLQFFFENDVIHGYTDYMRQFQCIVSLISDLYSEVGPIRVQSVNPSCVNCVAPLTLRGTIVVKLPLPREAITRLSSASGSPTPQDLQYIRNVFTQLGSFKNFYLPTAHTAAVPQAGALTPPSFSQESVEYSCPRANQYIPNVSNRSYLHQPDLSSSRLNDWNIVDQLYSVLLASCSLLDDVELRTVCLPIHIHGVFHTLFNVETRKVVRVDLVYYD